MGNENLQPRIVWEILREIYTESSSFKQNRESIHQRIRKWILKKSKILNIPLKIEDDDFGNFCVKKVATPGFEHFPSIMLQAHYDIYRQSDSPNYSFNGSSITIHENWMELIGTPIFDDSIVGVALILSVLINSSEDWEHGPIEALFTVKTDDKFIGVLNLDVNHFAIKSKLLMNFDSVDLGAITNGTAGCAEFVFSKKFTRHNEDSEKKLTYFELDVNGLKGGELGSEIHFFRANAIKLVARILTSISEHMDIFLCKWEGGDLYRFIPRSSRVKFAVQRERLDEVESIFLYEKETVIKKYKTFTEYGQNLEPNLQISLNIASEDTFISHNTSKSIVSLANLVPHGLSRSSSVENEFGRISNNFAKIKIEEKIVEFYLKSRGDNAPEFKAFNQSLIQLGYLGKWNVKNDYTFPVWEPQTPGPFMQYVKHKYEDILQKPVRVNKLYWVLEPGIIIQRIPDMQVVSIGPTEIGVYPENYKVRVSDIQVLYRVLQNVLKSLDKIDLEQNIKRAE